MKKFFCFIFLFSSVVVYSQDLDSLFNEYVSIRGVDEHVKYQAVQQAHQHDGKCAFGIAHELRENYDKLSQNQQQILSELLSRPELETSIVSPSGRFRIHYNTTGSFAPAYDVNELAIAFDSAYHYEVEILGFPPPRSDGTAGGDDKFDVYILNYGQGTYGETKFDNPNNEGLYQSYIQIDDDFSAHNTKGIDGARVTAAHEFHHAIQVGNYGFFNSEKYFYELTSTAMEEFVYDDINDYYYYLPQLFDNLNKTFPEIYSYALAPFYLYLQQRFEKEESDPFKGHNIIKRAWELLHINSNALYSLALSLFDYNSTFEYEYNNFGLWCYFTGYRANPQLYFDEGEYYPAIRPFNGNVPYHYEPPKKEYQIQLNQISNNYLVFNVGDLDTLVSLITYVDVEGYTHGNSSKASVKYILEKSESASGHKIVNDFYSTIESTESEFLKESNIFNSIIVNGGEFKREVIDYAFPQPFKYYASMNSVLNIPTVVNSLGYADLNIYTTSMDLVYSDRLPISNGQKVVVKWNGYDESGKKLPTGIYIYVTKSGNTVKKGKLVIYNE